MHITFHGVQGCRDETLHFTCVITFGIGHERMYCVVTHLYNVYHCVCILYKTSYMHCGNLSEFTKIRWTQSSCSGQCRSSATVPQVRIERITAKHCLGSDYYISQYVLSAWGCPEKCLRKLLHKGMSGLLRCDFLLVRGQMDGKTVKKGKPFHVYFLFYNFPFQFLFLGSIWGIGDY